jgi:hypothetical protein
MVQLLEVTAGIEVAIAALEVIKDEKMPKMRNA